MAFILVQDEKGNDDDEWTDLDRRMRSVYSLSSRRMSSMVAILSSVMTSNVNGFQFFSWMAPEGSRKRSQT